MESISVRRQVENFIDLFHPKEQKSLGEFNDLVYTNGQCYRFASMLAFAFRNYDARIVGTGYVPAGTRFSVIADEVAKGSYNHYYAQIDGVLYDIYGFAAEYTDDIEVDEQIHNIKDFKRKNPMNVQWLTPYLIEKDGEILFGRDVKLLRVLERSECKALADTISNYHNPTLEKILFTAIKNYRIRRKQNMKVKTATNPFAFEFYANCDLSTCFRILVYFEPKVKYFENEPRCFSYEIKDKEGVDCYNSGVQEYDFDQCIERICSRIEYHFTFINKREFIHEFVTKLGNFGTATAAVNSQKRVDFVKKFIRLPYKTAFTETMNMIFVEEAECLALYDKVGEVYYTVKRELDTK